MKTKFFFLAALLGTAITAFAQPSGYTRGGAEATMKSMKLLFTESFLFSKGSVNIPGDNANNKPVIQSAIAASDGVIKEFEQKTDEFIQSKPTAAVLKSNYHAVVSKATASASAIEKAASAQQEFRVLSAVCFLQELYLYKAYIAAAMKLYPEAISMQEKYDAVEAAINSYGSREAYMARMEKNQLDYVKSLRMKKAVFSDLNIEKIVKNTYEADWAVDKVTVTKVHITTNWVIEKNLLDIPLHKEVEVNMAIKKADGSCGFATGYVRQVYEGGGKYGGAYLNMPSPPVIVPCENLPK